MRSSSYSSEAEPFCAAMVDELGRGSPLPPLPPPPLEGEEELKKAHISEMEVSGDRNPDEVSSDPRAGAATPEKDRLLGEMTGFSMTGVFELRVRSG